MVGRGKGITEWNRTRVEKERNEAQIGGGQRPPPALEGPGSHNSCPRVGPLGGKSSTLRPRELSPGPVLAAGGALGGNRFPWL